MPQLDPKRVVGICLDSTLPWCDRSPFRNNLVDLSPGYEVTF